MVFEGFVQVIRFRFKGIVSIGQVVPLYKLSGALQAELCLLSC